MLIFLELNEINFKFLEHYMARGLLPHFQSFLGRHGYAETVSEREYHELEPWIQWVTAHTGLSLREHGVFRLGDIADVELEQVWETLASRGIRTGAISPMNAKCRADTLRFFVPDPWTKTDVIATPIVRRLHDAIGQIVNDNAQTRLTAKSAINLAIGAIVCARPQSYGQFIRHVAMAKARPWTKAIILDRLLADLFITSVSKYKTQFATLFLNAGAHIQHHYMFSSAAYTGNMRNPDWYIESGADPLLDVYKAYDRILGDVITAFPQSRIMLATGLHQDPHTEVTFYWRLRDHAAFLTGLDIPFVSVEPRMSRDFLVRCNAAEEAAVVERTLAGAIADDGARLFEVDNRGADLFVTLVYAGDIGKDFAFRIGNRRFDKFDRDVAFVAIKNGRHNGIGYFADSHGEKGLPGARFPLNMLHARVLDAFSAAA